MPSLASTDNEFSDDEDEGDDYEDGDDDPPGPLGYCSAGEEDSEDEMYSQYCLTCIGNCLCAHNISSSAEDLVAEEMLTPPSGRHHQASLDADACANGHKQASTSTLPSSGAGGIMRHQASGEAKGITGHQH